MDKFVQSKQAIGHSVEPITEEEWDGLEILYEILEVHFDQSCSFGLTSDMFNPRLLQHFRMSYHLMEHHYFAMCWLHLKGCSRDYVIVRITQMTLRSVI